MLNIIPSLPVEDVTHTVEFYRHVLGFELIGISGKGAVTRARLRLGNVELVFRSSKSDSLTQSFRKHSIEDRIIFHIYVEDISTFYDRIKKQVRIIRDLERTLFGHGEFVIEDVDGIILSFSQPYSFSRSSTQFVPDEASPSTIKLTGE